MPLDPHLAALLDRMAASGRKPVHLATLEEARAGFRTLTYVSIEPSQTIAVGSAEDIELDGAARALKGRVYRPDSLAACPTIAFFHGGGFVLGDLDTHDNLCRQLCREAEAVVVAVDYRLAPEHRFPAAVDDALSAIRWIVAHEATLGGAGVVGVAGDSAGGNLAAVLCQLMRDEGTPLAAQLLIYPAVDPAHASYPSYHENGQGYFMSTETLDWFATQYLSAEADRTDPRLAPLHAPNLSGLPPAVVVTAELDPIRDEGATYARALARAGSRADLVESPGMIHGFFQLGHLSPGAARVIGECARAFGALLRAV